MSLNNQDNSNETAARFAKIERDCEYTLLNGTEIIIPVDELPILIRLGREAVAFALVDPSVDLTKNEQISDTPNNGKKRSLNKLLKTLLIDPSDYDINRGTGYKGLRDGESIVLGRSHEDELHRFKEHSKNVSRNHLFIAKSPDGKTIALKDLGSTNGTYIGRIPLARPIDRTISEEWSQPSEAKIEKFMVEETFDSSLASERHPDRNEDNFLVNKADNIYAVFDGLGGHDGGEIAAETAKTIASKMARQTNEFNTLEDVATHLKKVLISANKGILKINSEAATTAVLAKVHEIEGEIYASVAHVGDSRAYLLSNGILKALTADHTAFRVPGHTNTAMNEQEKLANTDGMSVLSEYEIEMFQQRNRIGAYLGHDNKVLADIKHFAVKPGDAMILTTDGVHDNLTTNEMQSLLINMRENEDPARALTSAASRRAKEQHFRSKMDDITAIVINI